MIVRRFIFTFLVSMIPAVEIKGAIPFGIALGLPAPVAYAAALCGSSLVACFLAFFTNWFYEACRSRHLLPRFTAWMGRITSKHEDSFQRFGPLAIFAYVAVPIPGTGTWTGAIIAGVFNLKPKRIFLSVFCGNIVSGLIVSLVGNGLVSFAKNIIL
ncbi:MAG: small multi-drug export protein [Lachnospiraceae bacterium]|nr:small multi-drug export protein [Lachnospiraceae bacterium]